MSLAEEIQEALMKKLHLKLIVMVAVAVVIGSSVIVLLNDKPADTTPVNYTYEVVNVYPHDPNAFTQGLIIEEGVLYEGTGLYGSSTLRRVDMETGDVLQTYTLSTELFGEGITVFGSKIIQLTWLSGKGFVYDRDSFELLQEFEYTTEGWGITHNGSHLIMSDGTASLYFLNPETFAVEGHVEVHDEEPVEYLNELEYINGEVFANIWFSPKIARIDPGTGKVSEFLDLTTIRGFKSLDPDNVLNGIAYDAVNGHIFVTGKRWSQIFEISLIDSDKS